MERFGVRATFVTSTRPILILWIQPLELYPCFGSGELPIDAFAGSVASALPSIDFPAKGWEVRNTTVKALFRQNTQFDFGGVKPTSVFGRVMNLQSLHVIPSLFRRKRFIKRRDGVRVQVVADQNNFFGLRKILVQELCHFLRPVFCRFPFPHADATPVAQRLAKHEMNGSPFHFADIRNRSVSHGRGQPGWVLAFPRSTASAVRPCRLRDASDRKDVHTRPTRLPCAPRNPRFVQAESPNTSANAA